jgi:hypothetical protein
MQHDAWLVAIVGATAAVQALPEPLLAYRMHRDQQIGLRGAAGSKTLGRAARRAVRLTTSRSLRRSELESRASSVGLVSERLARVDGDAWTAACRDAAMDVADHLLQRIALPRARPQRVRAVAHEWRTRRYGRYSSGALSALADAISRT